MTLIRATMVGVLLASLSPAVSVAQTWTAMTTQPPGEVGAILLLRDGSVMAHNESHTGGITEAWYRLRPVVTAGGQLDYVDGVWSTTGSLPSGYQPEDFASAVLPDGRLIVEGGEWCGYVGGHPHFGADNQCDQDKGAIYDPVAELWTSVTPPPGWSQIGDAISVLLPNGVYMLSNCCDPGSATALFDAAHLQWPYYWLSRTQGNVGETGWTLMTNDQVLMVESWSWGTCSQSGYELYDYHSSQWSCGQGQVPGQLFQSNTGEIGAAVMLYNGSVIQFGANDEQPSTALYDVASDIWMWGPTPPDDLTQTDGPAALEPNGNVLALMSPWQSKNLGTHKMRDPHPGSCEAVEYLPPSSRSGDVGAIRPVLQQPRICTHYGESDVPGHLLVLPSGQIMLTYNLSMVEIFTPLQQAPWPNVAPQVNWVSNYSLSGGNTYSLTGYQLNGLSQANMFGDDFQDATNYPLVTLQDTINPSNLVFAPTFSDFDPSASPFSRSNSIAPNHLTGTNFSVPAGTCSGNYKLTVITNGISSNPIPVSVTNIQCSN